MLFGGQHITVFVSIESDLIGGFCEFAPEEATVRFVRVDQRVDRVVRIREHLGRSWSHNEFLGGCAVGCLLCHFKSTTLNVCQIHSLPFRLAALNDVLTGRRIGCVMEMQVRHRSR